MILSHSWKNSPVMTSTSHGRAPSRPLGSLKDDPWVFGYGSLLWNPGFAHTERLTVEVQDWHRRFSLRSVTSWGSPEVPGIAAALHPGGKALGAAFRVALEDLEEVLVYLDAREKEYLRTEVTVTSAHTGPFQAITYVMNPDNGLFLIDPEPEDHHRMIRTGVGKKGRSLDYLSRTADALAEMGAPDSDAHRLLKAVQTQE